MADAALESVSMMELHAAASRHIAAATGAEAGFITAGASAGLTLGTAAILAGLDLVKMERLPDTTGMKNEFIICGSIATATTTRSVWPGEADRSRDERAVGRRRRAAHGSVGVRGGDHRSDRRHRLRAHREQPAAARPGRCGRTEHGLPVLVDAAGQLRRPAPARRVGRRPGCLQRWQRAPGSAVHRDPLRTEGLHRIGGAADARHGRALRDLGSAGGSHPEVAPAGTPASRHRTRVQGRQGRSHWPADRAEALRERRERGGRRCGAEASRITL